MASSGEIRRYRAWYRRLLRLYPAPYARRFGAGMEQTFADVLAERAEGGRGLMICALWMFAETTAAIVRERVTAMVGSAIGMGRVALGTGLVLMVPLIAMRFTDEVQWSAFDFAFMGALVFGTGLAYQLVARRAGTVAYRLALGIALAGAFLLVWVNAAVGIIGEPGGPNLMYAAVLAVGLVGALAVRFRAGAMARPLYAMAIAQMLVPVIALVVARSELVSQPPGIYGVFVLNTCFALMFVASAMLFRRAGAVAAG